jgi:hypothetical protein
VAADPSKALELRRPQPIGINEARQLGETLAASGYFTDAREVAQAAVKVLAGSELGIGPIAAMTGIHIIKGNVTIGANLIAAQIKRHPVYDYKVPKHTDEMCTIEIYEHDQLAGTSTFTLDDARRADLIKPGSPWRAHPKNMVFARAISNAAKWYCPDILGGPAPYTPEEFEEPIEGTIASSPAAPPAEPAPDDQEGARTLNQEEADRLLSMVRTFAPTVEDVQAALANVGVTQAGDPERALRRLTVDQAVAVLDHFHDAKARKAEAGATDLPWVEPDAEAQA